MFSIAIDGPAGSGKSTVAKVLSEKINKEVKTIYLDTGAIYRAVAYYLINNISDEDIKNKKMVADVVEDLDIDINYRNNVQHVYVNGDDVTDNIRGSKVSETTSLIATYKDVRDLLLDIQRDIAKKNNIIMDGRDIGTCVLPNATIKIFLKADVKVRAKRRYLELIQRGMQADLKTIENDIEKRDEIDINREYSPLMKANDAIEIDTSLMSVDEVVEAIYDVFKGKNNV